MGKRQAQKNVNYSRRVSLDDSLDIDELSIMSYQLGYMNYFAFDIHICDSKLIVSLVLVPVI